MTLRAPRKFSRLLTLALAGLSVLLLLALTGCAAEKMSGAMAPEAPPPPMPPGEYGERNFEVAGVMADAPAREESDHDEVKTAGGFGPNDASVRFASQTSTGVAKQRAPGLPTPAPRQNSTPPKGAPEKKPDSSKAEPTSTEQTVARGPMLIYTADITMGVFEVQKSLASVEQVGRDLGGFLAKRDDTHITIRVPAAKFQEAVGRIEKLGDMLHRNVSAEDVSEQFNDLEIQLKNSRAVRDRLEQLLAKATKVEESLAIERELDRIKGEMDRIQGRLKFLRDRAEYSTITVMFQPKSDEHVGQTHVKLPARWLNELGLGRLLQL